MDWLLPSLRGDGSDNRGTFREGDSVPINSVDFTAVGVTRVGRRALSIPADQFEPHWRGGYIPPLGGALSWIKS